MIVDPHNPADLLPPCFCYVGDSACAVCAWAADWGYRSIAADIHLGPFGARRASVVGVEYRAASTRPRRPEVSDAALSLTAWDVVVGGHGAALVRLSPLLPHMDLAPLTLIPARMPPPLGYGEVALWLDERAAVLPQVRRLATDFAAAWPQTREDLAALGYLDAAPPVLRGADRDAADVVRVPKRGPELEGWQDTWELIRPLVVEGKGKAEIRTWLELHHRALLPSDHTLRDIIKAGKAGKLVP